MNGKRSTKKTDVVCSSSRPQQLPSLTQQLQLEPLDLHEDLVPLERRQLRRLVVPGHAAAPRRPEAVALQGRAEAALGGGDVGVQGDPGELHISHKPRLATLKAQRSRPEAPRLTWTRS